MVGDIEVDENGPLPGQALADDGDENDDANANANANGEDADGDASDGGGGGDGGESAGEAVVPSDLEPEDPAMGFEYEGEAREKKVVGAQKNNRPCEKQPCSSYIAK